MSLKENIHLDRLPAHIAIVMDGNGRWAKQQGKLRTFGHQHGVIPVRECTEACAELGVSYLTLYAFSTENWNRPKFEVNALMTLLIQTIKEEVKTLNKNNIRLMAIGDLASLPKSSYTTLMKAIDDTKNNTRLTLVLALSYSSKWELVKAIQQIATDVKEDRLEVKNINEQIVNQHLSTAGMPDPDLFIRTSGEYRISNFLLWQMAYTELYFSQKLWPDFRKEDLYQAIVDYQRRDRRFGLVSE